MLAIKCGRLIPVTAPAIDNGVMIIEDGKIKALGGADTPIPTGAEIIDASDRWVYPGLIDAASHLGVNTEPYDFESGGRDGMDISEPLNPHFRAADAINPFDEALERVRRAGVTTAFAALGPGCVIDGVGTAIKLRPAEAACEMILPDTEQLCVTLGDEAIMYFGGMQKRPPRTRMAVIELLRDVLLRAKERAEAEEPPKTPDRKLDALLPYVRGERLVRFECLRADDITTAVTLAEELGLKYAIVGATEAHKVAGFLREHKAPVIVEAVPAGPMRCMTMLEAYDADFATAGILEKGGNLCALTMNEVTLTDVLAISAGFATAYGLSPQAALEALTIGPARLLGLENRVGSLEVGKDADVAVFTGDALLNTSRCVMTLIDGKTVWTE